MIILHTSDWHLGATLYGHDRSADQKFMLNQIADIVGREQPDVMLVSGDVFDNGTPSAASQAMLDEALMAMRRKGRKDMSVILTSGNHDSPSRHVAFRAVYSEVGVHTVGSSTITSDSSIEELYDQLVFTLPGKGIVVAVPFINRRNLPEDFFPRILEAVKERNADSLPVVMMAHLTVADSNYQGHDNSDGIIVGGIESVDIDSLGLGYDYLALGHIHCPQQWTRDNAIIRYSGTPYAISFDEEYTHSVTIAEIPAQGKCSVRAVELVPQTPLVTVGGPDGKTEEELTAILEGKDQDGQPAIPKGAYLRFNLGLPEGKLFPDTFTASHLQEACDRLGYTYCFLNTVKHLREANEAGFKAMTVSDIRNISPIALAKEYAEKKGAAWTPDLEALLQEAISQTDPD